MKKTLPLAILAVAACLTMAAAPCTTGSTISALSSCAFGTITVSNGPNSWVLSNFGADNIVSTGYGIANGTNASLFVSVFWAPYTVGNQFGFSLTFTPTAGQTNLFSAQSANGFDQQLAFNTNLTVTASDASSNVIQYGVYLANWTFSDNTVGDVGPSVRVNKGIIDNGSTFSNLQADQTLLFRNPVSIGGITQPDFSVVDGFQINSGENGASASVGSYTNYFLPSATVASPVPEPMSWALMSAGLSAMALLRRRG